MTVGQRVRSRRQELGLTQEQLASRAPVALRTLQRLENDRLTPTLGTLSAVATILGCTVSELIEEAA